VIGSVANYLHRHGWELDQPVTFPAIVSGDADMDQVAKRDFKPQKTVTELANHGFSVAQPVSGGTLAAIARLEEEDGDRFFLTFKNFYVITRYNRSPLYAMAVYELSEAIRRAYEE